MDVAKKASVKPRFTVNKGAIVSLRQKLPLKSPKFKKKTAGNNKTTYRPTAMYETKT